MYLPWKLNRLWIILNKKRFDFMADKLKVTKEEIRQAFFDMADEMEIEPHIYQTNIKINL